ncbi:23S rRNA (uracil1939-C5)-methyltransferase [Treponema bryantii]|uniref:23S rRNA (Uracil1939-C5)-methyltransferase n=1 Tax=Treponema bryantii TaxID=163 RepID=A0A1I3J178_9SPIR|nr:TRAM domain-containing protein [Treponema bryantii]SFI54031.1 23S rRNA (uracil1939-C5)-methyltransferase [Treponema bryantii]
MTIIADKMVFGGKSLGKIDGKNVFVPYTIPGEKLEIEITEQNKDYDNAEIVKILEPSPHRIEPACRYYGKCGGCNMMHIEPAYQKELRKGILTDIFRQNGIDIAEKTEIISGPDFNYRSRFQLNDGGLSQRRSNVVIKIEECLCAENAVNDYLKNTAEQPQKRPAGRSHLFGSSFSEEGLKIAQEEKKDNKPNITGGGQKNKKLKIKENHYFSGTVASPQNTMTVNFGGHKLSFDVRGFFQSNLFVFEKVCRLITDLLPGGKNILDMYSGCGSISTFLTEKYENVVLVEHNRDALVYAEQNLAGTKHMSYGLSGASFVKTCADTLPAFDACTIDPPRSGMEKEVCQWLCKSNIPLILSLSCDPATHARDCAKLISAGYELKQMYLLDFYPNTSHIESLAVLELNR